MSFLVYWLVDNIQNGNISNHIGIMPLFTTDIAGIAGNFTTAFALHNQVTGICSAVKSIKNKEKSVHRGYVLAFIIYTFISFVGGFAMLGRKQDLSDIGTI